jgi:hypothetical protein
MRQLPCISLILSIAVFMGADDANKAMESDYDKLQGVWVVSESWADGEKTKDTGDNVQAIRFVNRQARLGEIVRGRFADLPSPSSTVTAGSRFFRLFLD